MGEDVEASSFKMKKMIDEYLTANFEKVIKGPKRLTQFLRPRITEGHLESDAELDKILQAELCGILQTVNHYLAETLKHYVLTEKSSD